MYFMNAIILDMTYWLWESW